MKTIVYQSHAPRKIKAWMRLCLQSVQAWAESQHAEYQFIDDALFDLVPTDIKEKYSNQPVVLSDLARLRLIQKAFTEGYERTLWVDTDVLIFAPERLLFSGKNHMVGREVWVQERDGQPKAYKKVHNAFLSFTATDSFLPFYADAAEAFLRKAKAPVVPQFIGPKFLTAQHNLVGLHVEEKAGMLSPLALADVLKGGGPALSKTVSGHCEPLAAVNMSASYEGRESDGVCNSEDDYERAVALLLEGGLNK
jgi:hypothetical protein